MRPRNILLPILILSMSSCSDSLKLSQWRGPERNGKYPETGLLKEWPEGGPELIWTCEGLGTGYGSAGFGDGRLYVLGMPDSTGVIYSFDMDGNLLWQKEYGTEWTRNYVGPRSTPSVAGGLLYFVSGRGVGICMDALTGEVVWSVDMREDFGAQNTSWGFAESPLLDGERIILTPGGKEHNIVALDRFIGTMVWSARGRGEASAYCSPILVQRGDARLIIGMTARSVLGVDADNGETYWSTEQKARNPINANSPVYSGGLVVCASAQADTLTGHLMFRLSDDLKEAEVGWRNQDLFNLMNGIIVHEGSIFSSTFRKKEWYCIDLESGKLNYSSDEISGGATIWADGLFYTYGNDGIMALIRADRAGCELVSSFAVEKGTGQHWAHPVIHEGRLYIRHGDALMCYDISVRHPGGGGS